MADQGSEKLSKDGKSQEASSEDDPMENCRKNIEAARKTLQAFDDLDRKWKVGKRERERERERERDIYTYICNTGSPAKVCRHS